MAFYISDVRGLQSLYEYQTYRQQRDVERLHKDLALLEEERARLELSETASATTAALAAEDAVVLRVEGRQNQAGTSPLAGASAQAVGLAGASVAYTSDASELAAGGGGSEDAPSLQPSKPLEPIVPSSESSAVIFEKESVPSETKAKGTGFRMLESSENLGGTNRVLARDIMTSPVDSLNTNTPLSEVGEVFRDKRFRHIPVVSEEGKLVGILSDRDFLRAQAAIRSQGEPESAETEKTVGEIMVRNVVSADEDTEVRRIAQVFFQERIGAMPIVSEGGQLSGMLTRSDVLRTVVERNSITL